MKKILLSLLSCVALATYAQAPAGVEIIDLGLSVKWASMNIGAEKATDYGDYFAWGETVPYSETGKTTFSWSTYKWMTEGRSSLAYVNKYQFADNQTSACWYSNGTFIGDNKKVLEAADDAATANWGSDWRMPTYDELYELYNTDNCSRTWYASGNTEFNGVAGYKVQSKKTGYTDNYIFLPAAGFRNNSSLYGAGSDGNYWSSSIGEYNTYVARYLDFDSSDCDMFDDYRYCGESVRPVTTSGSSAITSTPASGISTTSKKIKIIKNGQINIGDYNIAGHRIK